MLSSGTNSYLVLKSLSTAGMCVVIYAVYLFLPKGRQDTITVKSGKTFWLLVLLLVCITVADGLSYYLQLISAEKLPAVALYPIVTGGTMVMTALAGKVFFHERISRFSAVGILLAFLATFLFMF